MSHKSILLLFFVINIMNVSFFDLNAQSPIIKNKKVTITESTYADSLVLGGKIDGFNTLSSVTYKDGYAAYSRNFEPMKSIQISNKGDRKIIAPRLTFNQQRQWFDLKSWTTEIFRSAETDKEKILSLLYYITSNRVHYSPPNWIGYNVFNMFTIYGYGTCDIVSSNAVKALNYEGYMADAIYMPHHVIANVSLENGNQCLVDGDKEVFYLKNDNSSLAGFSDVNNDKFLIERTKHFGKATPYDKSIDRGSASIYYEKVPIKKLLSERNLSNYKFYGRSAKYLINENPPSYDFLLRPGESIIYSWDDAKSYSQNWVNTDTVPDLYLKNIIANGKYTYNSNFIKSIPDEMFFDYKNIGVVSSTDIKPNIYPTGDSSYVTIPIESPFPLLNASLKGLFFLNSVNDSVEVFCSLDNKTWSDKWLIKGIGKQYDSINLQNILKYSIDDSTNLPFAFKYYLKIIMHPNDINSPCGIDSIYIDNTFQVSRFFLPSLLKGKNIITYEDSSIINDRKVDVDITWQESSDNNPPSAISTPIFPRDGMTVDSLYFGFKWEPFSDPDGDEIVDYEFLLSDRHDMKYPLSPNFDLYVSSFGKTIMPYFKVLETGWLNDSATYYWKVRAKDARGAWSEWSPVWSFIPHGVMRPVNLSVALEHDTVFLHWQRNPKGKRPDFYSIYGSNETNGFVPDESHLIAVVFDTMFSIIYKGTEIPFSFYRIRAGTNDGQKSSPSDCDSIMSSYLFYTHNVLQPDKPFTLNLGVNEKYTSFFYFGYDTIFYKPDINIVSLPSWLNKTNEYKLSGLVDYTTAREMIFKDTLSRVVVKIICLNQSEKLDTIKIKSILNNLPPSPFLSKYTGFVGKEYKAILSTDDGDLGYGDHNYFEILETPSWLSFTEINDTLFLDGIPDSFSTGENRLKLKVTDSKGVSVEKVFNIKIFDVGLLSVSPNPVKENSLVSFTVGKTSEVSIYLISLTGEIIQIIDQSSYEPGIYQISFFTGNLSPGIYIMVANMTNNETRKISRLFTKIVK